MESKIIQGKPSIRPGSTTGYFLWNDEEGLHLIWTAKGRMHSFRGTISGQSPVTIKQLVKLESNDLVKQAGPNSIVWETRTQSDIDGVIFEAQGAVKFDLLVDNVKCGPNQINCGMAMRHPSTNPFLVKLP